MSNILFLVGNGFDLNLGLKTKFFDVVNKYLEIHKDSDDKNIVAFKKELKNNHGNWADFEKAMGEYTMKFTIKNKKDFVYQIDSFRNVLKNIFIEEEARIDYSANEEQIFFVFGKCVLRFYEFLSESSRRIIEPIVMPTKIEFNKSYKYNFITFNYTNVLDNCINLINSNRSKINLRKINNLSVDHIVNDSFGEVLHIHGTLRKDLNLGVDNITQIVNQDFQKDKDIHSMMIKPYINKELGDQNDEKAKSLIDKSVIICVFGMSIGETDKSWWNYIFYWLKSNKAHHLVLFYHNKEIDESNPRTKIHSKMEIKKLFFSRVDNAQDDEIKQCEDRIHIPIYDNDMFKLDLLFKNKE